MVNQPKIKEDETSLYYNLAAAFEHSTQQPILIHSLHGKMNKNIAQPEGFRLFEDIISKANEANACNKLYFEILNEKQLDNLDDDERDIVRHEEVGDALLFGRNGICVFESKSVNRGTRDDCLKALGNLQTKHSAVRQLYHNRKWLENCWSVVRHYLQRDDEMPKIHLFAAFPICSNIGNVPPNGINAGLLFKETIENTDELREILSKLLFARCDCVSDCNCDRKCTEIGRINETYRHFIAMLCASKAFRTFANSRGAGQLSYHYYLSTQRSEMLNLSHVLYKQSLAIDGSGKTKAALLTDPAKCQEVTVFLTNEQLEAWAFPRVDLRGPPGTGKTLLIMLKILQRSSSQEEENNKSAQSPDPITAGIGQ